VQAIPIEPATEPEYEPVIAIPAVAKGNLRRSVIMGACVGVIAVVVSAFDGHLLMGLFGCLGLGLGALNSRMVQKAVLSYGHSEAINKKAMFTRSILARLGLVTIVAIGCAYFIRPDGYGVFAGLAFFQMLMLGGATVPVYRQLHS
jgi:hypothetical protein